jgi:AcrR family transcriptional regulator
MVRIMVNEAAYTAKRNVISDVGQRAVETTGYEQVAIADLLSELHISSGALYHYFDSRSALLERMVDQAEQLVLPIVHDPRLSALDKLQRFFATLDHIKRSGWSRSLRKSDTATGKQSFTELIEKVKESEKRTL